MFCKIIDNKIVEPSSFFGERCFDLSYLKFISMPERFYIYDENTDNIIINPNFEQEQQAKENELLKKELLVEIDEMDKKRIRAICEPSIKDTETGETWLEFYTGQISELRNQVMALG